MQATTFMQVYPAQLKIQSFLLTETDAVEKLKQAPYCLNIKTNGNLILLNKTGLSDNENEIVKEANSIILDSSNNYSIVCFQGEILYNGVCFYSDTENETYAFPNKQQIDIPLDNNPKCILTKYSEGSTIKVFYDNDWYVSTSTSFNAFVVYHNSTISLGEYFKDIICKEYSTFDEYLNSLDKNVCYSYSLKIPYVNNCILLEKTKNEIEYSLISTFDKKTKILTVYIHNVVTNNQEEIKEIIMSYNQNERKNLYKNYMLFVYEYDLFIHRIVFTSKYYRELQKLVHDSKSSTSIERMVELRNNRQELVKYAHMSVENYDKYKIFNRLYFALEQKVYNLYVKRFILKEELDLNEQSMYKKILYKLHSVYIESRNNGEKMSIGIQQVKELLKDWHKLEVVKFLKNVNETEKEIESIYI